MLVRQPRPTSRSLFPNYVHVLDPIRPSDIRHCRRPPLSPRDPILPTDSRLGPALRSSNIPIAHSCLLREYGADVLPSFHLKLTCEPYVYVTMFSLGPLCFGGTLSKFSWCLSEVSRCIIINVNMCHARLLRWHYPSRYYEEHPHNQRFYGEMHSSPRPLWELIREIWVPGRSTKVLVKILGGRSCR